METAAPSPVMIGSFGLLEDLIGLLSSQIRAVDHLKFFATANLKTESKQFLIEEF